MTLQRLYQQRMGTFQASPPRITIDFPPVPVGLVWSGNIALTIPFGQDLQGIVWTLFRNGSPFLSWQEYGVACDVQALGGEHLQLVGTYLGSSATIPLFVITATWTGWSDSAANSPPLAPYVSGSNRGLVQVYNANGQGRPLAVAAEPQPRNVQHGYYELTNSGQSANLMPPGGPYRLWEVGLQVTAAQLSTTTGAHWLTATINTTNTGSVLTQCQVSTVPGQVATQYVRLPLHGYTLPAGDTIRVVTAAYTGDNANAIGTAVYDIDGG